MSFGSAPGVPHETHVACGVSQHVTMRGQSPSPSIRAAETTRRASPNFPATFAALAILFPAASPQGTQAA